MNIDLKLYEVDYIYINYYRYLLYIGLVIFYKLFDKKYRYDGLFGVVYIKIYIDFYVYSLVVKEIYCMVDGVIYEMIYLEGGVYYVRV